MIATTPTILIVDDEKQNLKILSDLLRQEAKIVLAKDGKQALQKVRLLNPDLILLDVVMPGMDGFAVIRELKQQYETSSIPVMFISGLNDVESESKGLELGACDYVYKPFHSDIVRARVRLHLKLVQQRNILEKLANIDPLTSIANRRLFFDRLDQDWSYCQQYGLPLSLVMVDIDYFKLYNDTFGHAAGDAVLEKVARALSTCLDNNVELLARYGGEEFVILLPGKSSREALATVQSCWRAVEDLKIPHKRKDGLHYITVSMGGVVCSPKAYSGSMKALEEADSLLYQAKLEGRNRVKWESIQ